MKFYKNVEEESFYLYSLSWLSTLPVYASYVLGCKQQNPALNDLNLKKNFFRKCIGCFTENKARKTRLGKQTGKNGA